MRLFVSEFLCSGAWPAELAGSLLDEGRAMLSAFLEDASRIDGIDVATTWDTRLGPPPHGIAEVHLVQTAQEERRLFEQLVENCDATFLIAPEFDDHLTRRAESVISQNRPLCGPHVAAIKLCADKLQLARQLQEAGVATIDTSGFDPSNIAESSIQFPCVIKPRYGAGSQETRFIPDAATLKAVVASLGADSQLHQGIVQPYLPGTPVSVAVLINHKGHCVHRFPPALQRLTDDGFFTYQGGQVPALGLPHSITEQLATEACNAVPGLRGYVGIDLIVPADAPDSAVVVEINPRLTTSYLGYRRLAEENLAERILFPDKFPNPIRWRSQTITFTPDGQFSTTT
ncbi:carbamoyl phosphate synthase-like protein [Symmachiella macrocystis]|uniref:Carbamoyl phosphate synthase-like protein n=1 Tax=Symmachiella macrocystis TaxID=2527985 RepID=A0A5C6B8W8_9PLAN|nr:ATP-grasp domain-containing protein [Symmachiella macrocystis]TWU08715.1 carbamoyl phosphate synthase-like protein [Symmachiella macrocystis]